MRRLAIPYVLFAALLTACSGTETAEAPCRVRTSPRDGADLSLTAAGACRGALTLALKVGFDNPAQPAWKAAADSPVAVEGQWTFTGADATRPVTLRNTSNAEVTVVGLEWTSDGIPATVDRMLDNGYQSWSYTGVIALPESLSDTNGNLKHGGDDEDLPSETPGSSWWYAAFGEASGDGFVVGAGGGTVLKTYIGAETKPTRRVRIVQGVTGDKIVLKPGETKQLDGLFIGFGNARQVLPRYAAHVSALHPMPKRQGALGGWGSWNVYFEKPTAALLRQDLAWAEAKLKPLGLTDFLLDDGYEPRWGEWTAAVTTFGATLPDLNDEIEAKGFTPTVWMAPFYVNVDSALVAQHPGWFVHDADGSIKVYDNVGTRHAPLDVSNPEARAFVADFVKRYERWGYKTLKIDFLFGGAIQGVRQDAKLTSLESYQLWMKTLREAVPGVHLVGCGAPILPSVGWVDSMRTGADISFSVLPEPRYYLYLLEARNSAYRWFTDKWWAIDPDVLILRGSSLSDSEAWMATVSMAMPGGNYLLGDGRQSSDLRVAMALDPEILAFTRDEVGAEPLDLLAERDEARAVVPGFDVAGKSTVPHLWQKSVGGTTWLAVFAWTDPSYSTTLDLPEGAHEILPPAAGGAKATRKAVSGTRTVAVPAHEVRLFTW